MLGELLEELVRVGVVGEGLERLLRQLVRLLQAGGVVAIGRARRVVVIEGI